MIGSTANAIMIVHTVLLLQVRYCSNREVYILSNIKCFNRKTLSFCYPCAYLLQERKKNHQLKCISYTVESVYVEQVDWMILFDLGDGNRIVLYQMYRVRSFELHEVSTYADSTVFMHSGTITFAL